MQRPTECPECRSGKCQNCTGDTLDPQLDEMVPCGCTGAAHQ